MVISMSLTLYSDIQHGDFNVLTCGETLARPGDCLGNKYNIHIPVAVLNGRRAKNTPNDVNVIQN
jgi:hypothetical protein